MPNENMFYNFHFIIVTLRFLTDQPVAVVFCSLSLCSRLDAVHHGYCSFRDTIRFKTMNLKWLPTPYVVHYVLRLLQPNRA